MPIDANTLIPSLWATLQQPAPTNTWPLGSATLAWSNLYLGSGFPVLDPVSGNIGYYARVAGEVSPVNFAYPPYNVLRYGTNTTPGTTSMATAFNNAYASAMAASPHGAIYVPAGAYLIPSPGLTWTNQADIRVYGDGPQQSVLVGDNTGGYTLLTISADTGGGTTGTNLNLSNFGIKASSGAHTNGLSVADYLYGSLQNMPIQSSGNSLVMAGMANITMSNLNVLTFGSNSAGNSALTLKADTAGIFCGPLTIDASQFEGASNVTTGGAINSAGTFGTTFRGCSIEALGASLSTVAEFSNQDDVTLLECYSESSCNTTNNNAFLFRLGNTAAPINFTIIGGHWFNGNGSFNCKYGIFGAKVGNLVLINTVWANFTTAAVTYGVVSGTTQILVVNGVCQGAGPPPFFDPGTGGPSASNIQFWIAPAVVSGFGTPTGAAIISNFPGATATLVQTSQQVAALTNFLKQLGFGGS